MKKFWNWVKNEQGERTLLLESTVAEESWYGDEVTPAAFREELFAEDGPITLSINSPGGDTIAASQIYTMLMEYPYDVTVKITGIAASAASVIAMAGTRVTMSPTSMMMVHNPFTVAMGDSAEMRRASQLLDEVKESIINAYELKTGMSRTRLSHMMNDETWMNAVKAKELGFCDEILFTNDQPVAEDAQFFATGSCYARKAVMNCLLDKIRAEMPADESASPSSETENRTPAADLMDRLARIKYDYEWRNP
ncbi:MAG: head maturation protease, ClpP-related [Candidatus Faecivicinus sp.]